MQVWREDHAVTCNFPACHPRTLLQARCGVLRGCWSSATRWRARSRRRRRTQARERPTQPPRSSCPAQCSYWGGTQHGPTTWPRRTACFEGRALRLCALHVGSGAPCHSCLWVLAMRCTVAAAVGALWLALPSHVPEMAFHWAGEPTNCSFGPHPLAGSAIQSSSVWVKPFDSIMRPAT